jgi:hypothetical protein
MIDVVVQTIGQMRAVICVSEINDIFSFMNYESLYFNPWLS